MGLKRTGPAHGTAGVDPDRDRPSRVGVPLSLPAALLLTVVLHPASPSPAAAQIPLAGGDWGGVELSGYVQGLSGWATPADGLGEADAVNGVVLRLAWQANLGPRVVLEVHDRFLADFGDAPATAAGFGVSAATARTVDLTSTVVNTPDARVLHDLDRLSATVYAPGADVTVGRQAVTWGTALLFPVADLWGRFSPFELDTQQKPGVDAARALAYPADGMELDLVVADGGRGNGPSAAAQVTLSRGWGDLFVAGGRFWDQAMLMGGVTWSLATVNLRGEAALPWATADGAPRDPRLTIGLEHLSPRWSLVAELHLNGLGASDPDRYGEVLASDALARGETYLLGRRYVGVSGGWSPDVAGRITVGGAVQANVDDGSVVLLPSVSWDVGRAIRWTAGGLVGVGAGPEVSSLPGGGTTVVPGSEFGSYGRFVYLQVATFF